MFFLWLVISLLFILSLVGVVVPFVPDTILLWVAFLIYKFIGETILPVSFWASMLILTVLILGSDFFTNAYFVKKHGGSKLAMAGAFIGLIVGTMVLGPAGILIGPFLFVIIISFLEKKESKHAFKIGIATTLAVFSSTVVKIILQIIMIIWFVFVVF